MSGPGITPYGGHADPVTAVAYAPDGATLAPGGGNGAVRIWDARTGQSMDAGLQRGAPPTADDIRGTGEVPAAG